MKRYVAALLLSLSVACGAGQFPVAVADLPTAVVQTVATDAPGALITNAALYSGPKRTYYVIFARNYVQDGKYRLAVNLDGTLALPISLNAAISPANLPSGAVTTVTANAPGAVIVAAKQVTTGPNLLYEVWAQTTTGNYYFVLNNDGSLHQPFVVNMHQPTSTPTPPPISGLPAAVTNAALLEDQNAVITQIVQSTKNGVVYYKITAVTPTTTYVMLIEANGTVAEPVSSVTRIAVDTLPAAVLQTVTLKAPGATIVSAEEDLHGVTAVYVVLADVQTLHYRLVINPDGSLAKPVRVTGTPPTNLPQAVQDAITQAAPEATITKATLYRQGGQHLYRVTAQGPDTVYKMILTPGGAFAEPLYVTQSLPVPSLPQSVANGVAAAEAGGTAIEATKITDGPKSYYIVLTVVSGVQYKVRVDQAGNVLLISK